MNHYWKCYRKSKSSPSELIMLNKDEIARNKVLVNKMDLGSYNTELLYNFLDITGDLPIYQYDTWKGNQNLGSSFVKP